MLHTLGYGAYWKLKAPQYLFLGEFHLATIDHIEGQGFCLACDYDQR